MNRAYWEPITSLTYDCLRVTAVRPWKWDTRVRGTPPLARIVSAHRTCGALPLNSGKRLVVDGKCRHYFFRRNDGWRHHVDAVVGNEREES